MEMVAEERNAGGELQGQGVNPGEVGENVGRLDTGI
jgi:hypothetical protein